MFRGYTNNGKYIGRAQQDKKLWKVYVEGVTMTVISEAQARMALGSFGATNFRAPQFFGYDDDTHGLKING